MAVDRASAPSRYLLKLASDEKLVARVRGGSEQAFAVLFERHHRGILSFCRHMLSSREEAEDAVQQVFANAYRDMLRSDRELNFKPWLYRIARNQCISVLRARRYEAELSDDEPSLAGLSDQVAQRHQLRDLLADLSALPVEQREALVLTELHDNSHVDVAAILGCEREKVKSLVFQARSSLIKSREARELPCEDVRRQLSVLRGGSLRRNTIRRHLQHCEGCRAFRSEVIRQRQAMAVILPVIPSAALKVGAANAIAAAGVATAAAGGGSAAGTAGPLAALAGKLGVSTAAVKGAAATVAVTVAAGGGAVAVKEVREPARDSRSAPLERSSGDPAPTGRGQGPRGVAPGAAAAGTGVFSEADDRLSRERRRLRKERRLREAGRRGTQGTHTPPTRKQGRAGPLSAEERARRRAQREAARDRTLKRRPEQSERPRKKRRAAGPRPVRKPAPRRAQPPVDTTPADPAPTEPTAPERDPTAPTR